MSSSNAPTVLIPPSFPTVLLVPEQLRSDEAAQMQLRCLLRFLSSEKRYDRFEERIDDVCKRYATSAGSDDERHQLLLHAWERVKKQLEVELKVKSLESDLGTLLSTESENLDQLKTFDVSVKSVEKMVTELRHDWIMYRIWALIAGIDGGKCKNLIMEALDCDNDLKTVDPRTFVKNLLKDGHMFGPGVTGDARMVRTALQAEVAKYDLDPGPNDKDVPQFSVGVLYAFESLVNDRRWVLWHRHQVWGQEELNFIFREPSTPSFPTPFLNPGNQSKRDDAKQHVDISSKVRSVILKMRLEARLQKPLKSVSHSNHKWSSDACKCIDAHYNAIIQTRGTGSKPEMGVLKNAWDRSKKQINLEAFMIRLAGLLWDYEVKKESPSRLKSAKAYIKRVLSEVDLELAGLGTGSDLVLIWAQVSSIDEDAARKGKAVVDLEDNKTKISRSRPRDFVRILLQDGQAFASHAKGNHAQAVRRALQSEVAKYDSEAGASPDGQGLYAFESIVHYKKWLLMQTEHLEHIKEKLKELGALTPSEEKKRKPEVVDPPQANAKKSKAAADVGA